MMKLDRLPLVLTAVLLSSCGVTPPVDALPTVPKGTVYDMVISGGRVIDPETETDAILSVAIQDGQIAEISASGLHGREMINAAGLVVSPGFIDIHSHSPTPLGTSYQVRDGVTTQIDLEAGAFPVAAYGFTIKGRSPINYANSVSHLAVRVKVIEGRDEPYLFNAKGPAQATIAAVKPADADEIAQMRVLLAEGLDQGGLGIGVLLDYISGAVRAEELAMIFELAGERNVPVTVHVRRGLPGDPTGLDEVIALAEQTKAPLLVCHITHSAMQAVPEWLAKIEAANARGARITTETLSYAAGGTNIGAAVFGRDWQSIFNITPEQVQWTATGEWLTVESFARYRAAEPSGMVNHHYVKEEWMEQAIAWPGMFVVSDVTPAFSEAVLANPNLSGTFGRFLGHYVRDRGVISLPEAIRRITLMPAEWLGGTAPIFARKGRLQKSMDADITVFDADKVNARSTYGKPYEPTHGIVHVVVGGELVVRDGALIDGSYPGQHLVAEVRP